MNGKTLVVVMSHSAANPTLARHWSWFLKGDCDILGIGRTDTHCVWPNERLVGAIDIGLESYASGDNHITRLLGTIEHCLKSPELKGYSGFCLLEYDCVIFKPVPKPSVDTLHAKLAGHRDQGFIGENYYHTPWTFDRIMGGRILKAGRAMLRAGLIERGFIDRFLGLMADLYDLDVKDTGNTTYTRNTIEPCHVEEARAAVDSGIWMLHGCKTEECLRDITLSIIHEP